MFFTFVNMLIGVNNNYLEGIFGDFLLIVWSFTIYFGILYLMIAVLSLFILFNKWLKVKFHKGKNDYDEDLVVWIGENYISERFLYRLFSEKADTRYNDIDNIVKIRGILEDYLKGDKLNYKLLRNHLEFKRKNEFIKKFKIFIFSATSLFLSSIVIPYIDEYSKMLKKNIEVIIQNNGINKIMVIISNLFTTMAGFSLIIIFITLIFSIYLFCRVVYEVFTEKDRSVKYLITVIDKILEEM